MALWGATALLLCGCGDELQQAQPSSGSGGSQGDDGGPGTSVSVGQDSGSEAGSASGGATSTTASTTASMTSDDGSSTAEPGSDSGVPSSDSSTGPAPTGCRSGKDCADPTPFCDRGSGACVACLPGGEPCEVGTYCDPAAFECVPGCDETSGCDGQVCDVASHTCVDCLGDADCPRGVCDEPMHVCVGCVDDDDCDEGAAPACDTANHTCVECVSDDHCPAGVCTNNECVTIGYDCMRDSDNCNDGEQCCDAPECGGDCMIPCNNSGQCPGSMGCAHGYCFFPCDDNDADCAAWPGYSCQHMGNFCEAD